MRRFAFLISFALLSEGAAAAPVDRTSVARAFRDARQLCEGDGGKLWGVSLCGPIVVVDAGTREAVASGPDPDGLFTADGAIYRGTLPKAIGLANYSFSWKKESWTMLLAPLPDSRLERDRLMLHELWHHVQARLNFPQRDEGNAHLDQPMGRTWLRLEWRALDAALRSTGRSERIRRVEDALLFRDMRRSLFAAAAREEGALEMHEGLAEYTGTRLAASRRSDRVRLSRQGLLRVEQNDSYVRSFAYGSGPAWGLLLDQIDPNWTRQIRSTDDLGDRVRGALKLNTSSNLVGESSRRASRYAGESVVSEEMQRSNRRGRERRAFEQRFVLGAILILPLRQMQMQFDPRQVRPFHLGGNIYPSITVSDVWGRIEVRGGALISGDWKRMIVSAPENSSLNRTPDWKLELEKGWTIVKGDRAGDFTLRPPSP
ncbi:MAG TPA: hypothetical protein VNM92_18245 [Thermoanaerobaculia bacterium]|nr:hypothetical protein [Thermoanaerobaculia bacterium]